MCGRLACGLRAEEIKNCCCYKEIGSNEFVRPVWKNAHNLGKTYKPSFNICPTEIAPVLLAGCHFDADSRFLVPMVFGVIPSWSKGDGTSKYSTINCRIEGIKTSNLYGPLLKKGQRCVVICNGFFEWKREIKQNKKPYFVHAEQGDDILIENPDTWNLEFTSEKGFKGLKPLRLAALFERQKQKSSEDENFSFTIITKEASSKMSWLHLRTPAIIETEEQLQIWLDCKQFDQNEALNCLSHFENVICYPVSTMINTATNKDIGCIAQNEKLTKCNQNNNASMNFFKNWLGKRPKSESSVNVDEESDNISKAKKKKEES